MRFKSGLTTSTETFSEFHGDSFILLIVLQYIGQYRFCKNFSESKTQAQKVLK